jgi:hypothetical protein
VDTYLIDYSAAKLAAAVIKATAVGPAGEHPTGVIRYIDAPNMLGTKHTNQAEYQDHVRNGLTVHMYFEVNEDDALGGYAQGQAYAQRAKAGADYLGYQGVILFCCDRWFVKPGRPTISPDVWQSYLDGAVSVLGRSRVGAYGFGDAMDAAVGHVDYFVQCGALSVVRDFVHIWQDNNTQPYVGGIQTDRLLVLKPINQGDDLSAEDTAILKEIRNQITGSPDLNQFPGWESFANPKVKMTVTDFVRAIDKNIVTQGAQISALAAAVAAATTSPAITLDAITKVVDDAVAQHIQITGTVSIAPAPPVVPKV